MEIFTGKLKARSASLHQRQATGNGNTSSDNSTLIQVRQMLHETQERCSDYAILINSLRKEMEIQFDISRNFIWHLIKQFPPDKADVSRDDPKHITRLSIDPRLSIPDYNTTNLPSPSYLSQLYTQSDCPINEPGNNEVWKQIEECGEEMNEPLKCPLPIRPSFEKDNSADSPRSFCIPPELESFRDYNAILETTHDVNELKDILRDVLSERNEAVQMTVELLKGVNELQNDLEEIKKDYGKKNREFLELMLRVVECWAYDKELTQKKAVELQCRETQIMELGKEMELQHGRLSGQEIELLKEKLSFQEEMQEVRQLRQQIENIVNEKEEKGQLIGKQPSIFWETEREFLKVLKKSIEAERMTLEKEKRVLEEKYKSLQQQQKENWDLNSTLTQEKQALLIQRDQIQFHLSQLRNEKAILSNMFKILQVSPDSVNNTLARLHC